MRQEGLLADTNDMQAYIDNAKILHNLKDILSLEKFVLEQIDTDAITTFNYKQLNADAKQTVINDVL